MQLVVPSTDFTMDLVPKSTTIKPSSWFFPLQAAAPSLGKGTMRGKQPLQMKRLARKPRILLGGRGQAQASMALGYFTSF